MKPFPGCARPALFQQAADQDYAPALFHLSNLYFNGQGVPRNMAKVRGAATSPRRRIETDGMAVRLRFVVAASFSRVVARLSPAKRSSPTARKAAALLERAAEQGFADAQFNLGMSCYAGQGVQESLLEVGRSVPVDRSDESIQLPCFRSVGRSIDRLVNRTSRLSWRPTHSRTFRHRSVRASPRHPPLPSARPRAPLPEARRWWARAAAQGHADACGALRQTAAVTTAVTAR